MAQADLKPPAEEVKAKPSKLKMLRIWKKREVLKVTGYFTITEAVEYRALLVALKLRSTTGTVQSVALLVPLQVWVTNGNS